jgi:hypothetical protein
MKKLSLFIAGALLMVACNKSSKLQGTWKIADRAAFIAEGGGPSDPMIRAMVEGMRFNFDKQTAVFDLTTAVITYSFTVDGDTLLLTPVKARLQGREILAKDMRDAGKADKFTYRFSGDTLTLDPTDSKAFVNNLVLLPTTPEDATAKAEIDALFPNNNPVPAADSTLKKGADQLEKDSN